VARSVLACPGMIGVVHGIAGRCADVSFGRHGGGSCQVPHQGGSPALRKAGNHEIENGKVGVVFVLLLLFLAVIVLMGLVFVGVVFEMIGAVLEPAVVNVFSGSTLSPYHQVVVYECVRCVVGDGH